MVQDNNRWQLKMLALCNDKRRMPGRDSLTSLASWMISHSEVYFPHWMNLRQSHDYRAGSNVQAVWVVPVAVVWGWYWCQQHWCATPVDDLRYL